MIPAITLVAGIAGLLTDLFTLSTAASAPTTTPEPAASNAAGSSFSDSLKTALDRVDDTVTSANQKATAFASGDSSVSLSDVMVSLEQANLSLQMATSVREKIVAAYTNIMNMSV
jgi:flagellar hook-basal body complex protein FliE